MSSASRSPAITLFTCDCCRNTFDYTPNTDHGTTNCITCVPIVKETLKKELIALGNRLYRGVYTYDKVKYVSDTMDVDIYCTVCEDYFQMSPRIHIIISKGRCKICRSRNYNTRNLKTFIENANRAHKGRYSYAKSVFKNISTPLVILCNQCTHEFSMCPTKHIVDLKGCSTCAAEDKITTVYEKFLEDAKNICGDSYTYADSEFVNMTTAITITHDLCGYKFKMTPTYHINNKTGCKQCRVNKTSILSINNSEVSKDITPTAYHNQTEAADGRYDIANFTADAKEIHRGAYSYEKIKLVDLKTKIEILCLTCLNVFWQKPSIHLSGSGCSYCSSSESEKVVYDLLKRIGFTFIHQHKFTDCKDKKILSFDFYIPDEELLIEYQGRQHYESVEVFGGAEALISQRQRDNIKYRYCKANNYNLLEIKYDENPKDVLKKYFEDKGIWDDIDPDNPDNK